MINLSITSLSKQAEFLRTTTRPTVSARAVGCRRFLSKKSKLRHAYQRTSGAAVENHKQFYPDSFIYRRGDHPYGTREYLLVRPKPMMGDTKEDVPTPQSASQTYSDAAEPLPSQLQILATIHANNNILFGATINTNVAPQYNDPNVKPPSVLDLCPILLHAALDDCSDEGEQPQALSTLHGLSAWVRQCLEGSASSVVLNGLREQVKNSEDSMSSVLRSTSVVGRRFINANANVQLECITAIATGIPRPGHTVVGQGTHRDGAHGWEALAREFALLEYDDDVGKEKTNIQLSEECLLYRYHADSCELVEIELLADTSPAYLASAGGCMARFFLQ
jgi:hypothetical protein